MNTQSYPTIILVLVILIIIFIVLREFICWYWKINEKISLQKRTNLLLENIFMQNGGKLEEIKEDEKDDLKNIYLSTEGLINNAYDQLSDKEQAEVNRFIRFGIWKGNIIVLHEISRKIEKFDEKRWEKIKDEGTIDQWIIIIEK